MANQKMLALAFALATSVAHADNCQRLYQFAEFKTTYATEACPTASLTCTKTGTWPTEQIECECSQCCQVKPLTCADLGGIGTGTSTCGADRTLSNVESVLATVSTAATFDTDCCVAKVACSTMSSCTGVGMMKNAANDAVKCASTTCTDAECCMVDPDKCLGVTAAGGICGADRHNDLTQIGTAATLATYDATCCAATTCGSLAPGLCLANRVYDSATAATASTWAAFDTNCCKAAPQCSSITCTATAGYMDNAAVLGTTFCTSDPCTNSECCSMDPTKCLGFAAANALTAAQDCDTSDPPTTHPGDFRDSAKNGNACADAASFKTSCCTARASCQAFKDHSYSDSGSASGAERMQKPATGVLFLLTGAVLAISK